MDGEILSYIPEEAYILEDKCIGCGICVDSCPVEEKALKFNGKKSTGIQLQEMYPMLLLPGDVSEKGDSGEVKG